MKTYYITTIDRHDSYYTYEIQANSLEEAEAIANRRVNLPNGGIVMDVTEKDKLTLEV